MRLLLPTLLLCPWLAQAQAPPPGALPKNVTQVRFASPSRGKDVAFSLILPKDYDDSNARYPVLYLLHGYWDDHTTWSRMTNLAADAAGRGRIIVMPDVPKSWYVNQVLDPKARDEDLITQDLIRYVDGHYRTLPQRRARAVAGLSTGGFGAAYLGLKRFDLFGAVGIFSGGVGVAHNPSKAQLTEAERQWEAVIAAQFGPPGSPSRAERDVFLLADKVPADKMPLLFMACGAQDALVAENREFAEHLAARAIPYEYREISPRGHSWEFWEDEARAFLAILDHGPLSSNQR